MIYVLKINDEEIAVLLGAKKGTIFKYKDLSINIVSEYFIGIETNYYKISAGTKTLKNHIILYNDDKKTFIVLHKIEYGIIEDNIYSFRFIHLDDFSVVNH